MSSAKTRAGYTAQPALAHKPPNTSLVEDSRVCQVVERIVHSVSSEPSQHQDLMQEALLHLWRLERERPHQTTSWYLQSCRFRLQHYLSAGRSVDSVKRRGGQILFPSDEGEGTRYFGHFMAENHPLEQASAQDILSTLATRLKPKERAVLDCLADGLSATEIARKLKLSCPTVTKYRRKIAQFAVRLRVADFSPQLPSLALNPCAVCRQV
jgi:RNA polymerase sigma factor (sigma-70 family)